MYMSIGRFLQRPGADSIAWRTQLHLTTVLTQSKWCNRIVHSQCCSEHGVIKQWSRSSEWYAAGKRVVGLHEITRCLQGIVHYKRYNQSAANSELLYSNIWCICLMTGRHYVLSPRCCLCPDTFYKHCGMQPNVTQCFYFLVFHSTNLPKIIVRLRHLNNTPLNFV